MWGNAGSTKFKLSAHVSHSSSYYTDAIAECEFK